MDNTDREYQYAKYTQTLYDTLIDEPHLLDNFRFKQTARNSKFKDIFKATWNGYEIGAETIKMFKFNIENVFKQNVDYYEELLNAYDEKINMLDGIKTTTNIDENYDETIDDTLQSTQNGSDTNTGTYNSTNKRIDLPRTDAKEQRPTYIDETMDTSNITRNSNNTITNTNDRTKNNKGNKTISITGGANVIELKKQYMKLIQNIYLEFAMKFEKCFLTLFD